MLCLLPVHADLLFGLFFDPEDGGDKVPRKRRLTSNGLHGFISQKMGVTVCLVQFSPTVQECCVPAERLFVCRK
jgi:hypothetical protein